MGLCYSANPVPKSKNRRHNGSMPNLSSTDTLEVESPNRYDEEAVNILRREYEESPEIFLLNNILMSVMFFENYENEISKIANAISRQEKELNHKLIKEESKQCVMPDVIFENVNKHVRFRPIHGPKKHSSEPLTAQRLYVVHDNVEVVETNDDTSHYSGIDKPNYKVQMEITERNGYIKLGQIEQMLFRPKRSNSEETIYNPSSTSSEGETNINQITENIDRFNGILDGPSTSTGMQSEEYSDSYDYTTITKARTPQPIRAKNQGRKSNSLPNNCFTVVMMKNLEELEDLPDSDSEDVDIPESNLYKPMTYINSTGFMRYFKNSVFPNSLGKVLGFDPDTIKAATSIPGTIFCDSYDAKGNITLREIIPAVSIQWPAAITFEWALRDDRPTITDKRTKLRYTWPTDSMINEIKRLHCVAIPRGCLQKRGENKEINLEWEVGFPKAEKYIETRMSHAQMKSFLFLLALHKSFVEPVTKRQGLLVEHLRILMYWECEANYPNWPENRLGTKLMMVLKHLYDHLGKGNLSNYFIRNKNVLESIPGKFLRPAQKLIFRTMESPVMYFLSALRNLRYMSGKFYPALDIKKLHTILTTEGIKSANPLLFKVVEGDRNPVKRKRFDDPNMEWNRQRLERMRRKNKKKEDENKEVNLSEEPRASIDSIDLQWSLEKNIDMYKKRSLLIFFIEHFIEISKRSLALSTTKQSLFYLKQAYYLSKLLEETYGCYPDAVEYQDKIREAEQNAKRMAAVSEQDAPLIPRRNSLHAHNGLDLVQQVKTNNIHLNNLTKSYSGLHEANKRKVKRSVSNKVVTEENGMEMRQFRSNSDRMEVRKTISFNTEVQNETNSKS